MYKIYQTEGLILKEEPFSEGSKTIYIFTEALGLVLGRVQSGRTAKSKMRFHLQPLSFVSLDLVRGREVWRVVGAKDSVHLWSKLAKKEKDALARVCRFILRVFQGEEANREVFKFIKDFLTAILAGKHDNIGLLFFETVTVGKILKELGYISSSQEIFREPMEYKGFFPKDLLIDINKALKASQL